MDSGADPDPDPPDVTPSCSPICRPGCSTTPPPPGPQTCPVGPRRRRHAGRARHRAPRAGRPELRRASAPEVPAAVTAGWAPRCGPLRTPRSGTSTPCAGHADPRAADSARRRTRRCRRCGHRRRGHADPRSEPRFPAGPTASQITVPATDTFPLSDAELLALLSRPPDLGPLADPRGAPPA